jgi:hypothetical protein
MNLIHCLGVMRKPGGRRMVMLGAVTAAALCANAPAAAWPASCDVRLTVELTPDVPNPRDEGFLSSLLGDHVSYLLNLQHERSDSDLVLELTGPGPDYRCQRVIEAIRKDARVLSVHVSQGSS